MAAGKHRLRRAEGIRASFLIWRTRAERQQAERAAELIETSKQSDWKLS